MPRPCVGLRIRTRGRRGRCYACNHWYSWFYDMRTTRVVWALSVALPDRLLVQARAGKLVDLRESCLWQRGARRVRSVVAWWAGPGWRADVGWPPAALSIYLATRSTRVSICLSDLGRPPAARGERAERGARAGALVREPSLPGRRVARVAPRVPDQACSEARP